MRRVIRAHYIERTIACHNFPISGGLRAKVHLTAYISLLMKTGTLNMRASPVLLFLVSDLPSGSLPTVPRWHKACSVT